MSAKWFSCVARISHEPKLAARKNCVPGRSPQPQKRTKQSGQIEFGVRHFVGGFEPTSTATFQRSSEPYLTCGGQKCGVKCCLHGLSLDFNRSGGSLDGIRSNVDVDIQGSFRTLHLFGFRVIVLLWYLRGCELVLLWKVNRLKMHIQNMPYRRLCFILIDFLCNKNYFIDIRKIFKVTVYLRTKQCTRMCKVPMCINMFHSNENMSMALQHNTSE